ncbi:hypothetical protein DSO57_1005754 [Entomophthora muscae]|uniref:Uncharacterized protein n=1 Tax=Entomophthora muscae TaxID=34485 RepID=A0ACC2U671_9FUNG|nr:hypothetical protein DSO57_1005754 [Entomophthora muscae]
MALTGFQVANLVPYFARILPQLLGLYTPIEKEPSNANQVTQDGQGPANLLSCKPELLNYSETHQTFEDDSPNGHQIAVNLVPSKTQTYTEVVACLKEVTARPPASPANDHQLMPVSSPEWLIQFDWSGDVVKSSGGTKYCHFCSSEQP